MYIQLLYNITGSLPLGGHLYKTSGPYTNISKTLELLRTIAVIAWYLKGFQIFIQKEFLALRFASSVGKIILKSLLSEGLASATESCSKGRSALPACPYFHVNTCYLSDSLISASVSGCALLLLATSFAL